MILLAFEPTLSKMSSHLATGHSFLLKKDCMHVGKILLDTVIVQIMPTSVTGRQSFDAEMNAGSFEDS